MSVDHTRPDPETVEAEAEDAKREHRADREPTEEEELAAEQVGLEPSVSEHFKQAAERGADAEGEGRIP